ncbi:MAG: Ornithine carbamoyltransferase [Acidobacteriota bacterium]|jgi:ornithine carbamoyltransferase
MQNFLSILDLNPDLITTLLKSAADLKRDRDRGMKAPTATVLNGKHVGMLFEKPSLRTRVTFTIGVRELGGDVVDIPADVMHADREPIQDVARNLERWVDAVVIRTFGQERLTQIAEITPNLHIVNALSNEEHPCQALADMQTLFERWGSVEGKRIAYVGDGNNVCTSLVHAAMMLGMHIHVATPKGFELPDEVVDQAAEVSQKGAGLTEFTDPKAAVRDVDAVYTDVWTSMGQEVEYTERKKTFKKYQVNESLMALAKPGALFMHCLPAHRGEEVSDEVIESSVSVVFDQAENRLHAQKALLVEMLK